MDAQSAQGGLQGVRLFTQNLAVEFIQRFQNKMYERPVLFWVGLFACELAGFGVEIDVSP